MSFPSSVRNALAAGIVGEIVFDGPHRAEPRILNSSDAALNVIGRAFTQVAASDTDVEAGGSGVFAGILANPLEYASYGTAAGGPLAPTITLPNQTGASLVKMGTMIVSLTTGANIGDEVCFVNATGELLAVAPGAAAGAGNTKIPNCKVVRENIPAAGLAYIQLTN